VEAALVQLLHGLDNLVDLVLVVVMMLVVLQVQEVLVFLAKDIKALLVTGNILVLREEAEAAQHLLVDTMMAPEAGRATSLDLD
jgi:hypothetical protein